MLNIMQDRFDKSPVIIFEILDSLKHDHINMVFGHFDYFYNGPGTFFGEVNAWRLEHLKNIETK